MDNAGSITLGWRVTQDRCGYALIAGHVITRGRMAGYCNDRLLVEMLGPQGQVMDLNVGFIPGYLRRLTPGRRVQTTKGENRWQPKQSARSRTRLAPARRTESGGPIS